MNYSTSVSFKNTSGPFSAFLVMCAGYFFFSLFLVLSVCALFGLIDF